MLLPVLPYPPPDKADEEVQQVDHKQRFDKSAKKRGEDGDQNDGEGEEND
jgi:hypothetical protein